MSQLSVAGGNCLFLFKKEYEKREYIGFYVYLCLMSDILCFSFCSAKEAMLQIEENGYAEPFAMDGRKLCKIGNRRKTILVTRLPKPCNMITKAL